MRDLFPELFPACVVEKRVVSGAEAGRLEEQFLPWGTTLIAIGEKDRRAFFDAPGGDWEWLRVTGGDYPQTLSQLKKLTPAGRRLSGLLRLTAPEDIGLDQTAELAYTVQERMGEDPELMFGMDMGPEETLTVCLLLRERKTMKGVAAARNR